MAEKPKEPLKKNPLQELIDKMPAYATKADLVQAIRTNIKSNIQARFQTPAFLNSPNEPTPPVDEKPV
jgi:hypothetical protein